MNTNANNVVNKLYRRIGGTSGAHDTHTFNVFMAVDGVRSIGTIAQEDLYEIEDLSAVIEKLVEMGSIEPVTADELTDSRKDFFTSLEAKLSMIMGPVSSIIIQDNVSALNCQMDSFPMSKANELINLISRTIPDASEAEAFVLSMAGK